MLSHIAIASFLFVTVASQGFVRPVVIGVSVSDDSLPPGFSPLTEEEKSGRTYGACADRRPQLCLQFRSYCTRYAALRRACPRACGVCRPIPCFDSEAWCPQYAGFCGLYNLYDRCKKTCGRCNQGGGIWGPYGAWGSCSKPCGVGRQTRGRSCEGGNCIGSANEERSCNTYACQQSCTDVLPTATCEIWKNYCFLDYAKTNCQKSCGNCRPGFGGIWGAFGNWGKCTKSCGGGYEYRKRVCRSGNCIGDKQQRRRCNDRRCKGIWNNWTKFGECSRDCGSGKQERTRTCKSGNCEGIKREERGCNTQKCESDCKDSSRFCYLYRNNCDRSSIRKVCRKTCGSCPKPGDGEWGDWSQCSRKCGTGKQRRDRECRGTCSGNAYEEKNCNTQACISGWHNWGKWNACSKKCGGGTQKRTRRCKGDNCKGPREETRDCNTKTCNGGGGQCSVQCGTGTKYSLKYENGKQYRFYESCNHNMCTAKTCGSQEKRMKGDREQRCCKIDNSLQCGSAGLDSFGRILGGENAAVGEFPWQVAIKAHSPIRSYKICGGTIVSNRWIVTAAHCVRTGSYAYPANMMSVVYGRTYVLPDSSAFDNYNVQKVAVHPSYDFPIRDIAMVKLKQTLSFNSNVQPACLFHGSRPEVDSTCYITGFGLKSNNAQALSAQLQKAVVEYFPMALCLAGYRNHRLFDDINRNQNKIICAGSVTSGQDTCSGDSGGPLVCQNKNSCGFTLVGITSFGADNCAEVRQPGMFTDVAYHKSWIQSTLRT